MSNSKVTAATARATARENPHSRWPARTAAENNLYPNCIPSFTSSFTLGMTESVFAIGSCVSGRLGEYLGRQGVAGGDRLIQFPQEELAPGARNMDLLAKYTPPGLYQELAFTFDQSARDRQWQLIVEGQAGEYHDLALPGWFPPVTQERARVRREQINQYFENIRKCSAVFLEMGSVECWRDKQTKEYLNTAPRLELLKKSPGRYTFQVLTYGECMEWMQRTVKLIRQVHPEARIILAVSPEAMDRTYTGEDVIIANTHGKSILRAVAGELSDVNSALEYFPSYEMAIYSDSENTWRDNLRHVRIPKVDAILRHFVSGYYPELSRRLEELEKTHKDALTALAAGALEEAYQGLSSLRARQDSNAVLNDLAVACEKTGRDEEALALHAELNARGDRRIPRLLRMANSALRLRQHELAIAAAKGILESRPQEISAQILLVEAYLGVQQHALAIALSRDLARRIEADPKARPRQPWVYKRLEKCLRRLDLPEEADRIGEIAVNPGLPR